MDQRPLRSTVSILRTVLHLLEDDPALSSAESDTVHEFRHATLKLIAEIQAKHGLVDERKPPSVDHAAQDTAFKAIKDHR